MSTVWSEDFNDYADTTAMLAVWTVTDPESVGTVSLTSVRSLTSTGKSLRIQFTGVTPGTYPAACKVRRTVTGLLPGQSYTMSLSVYDSGPDYGAAHNIWSAVTYSGTLDNFSGTVTADSTGTATVYVAPGVTSGNPTDTMDFDGITLTPVTGPLLTAVLLDPALLYVGGTLLGAIRGGLTFAPNPKYEAFDFDGSAMAVAGNDQLVDLDPTISGAIITVTEDQLAVLEPGSSTTTTGTLTTLTPRAAHVTIASGSLVTNVRAVWRRVTGGFFQVRFPLALCTQYRITGKDKNEPVLEVEFHARAAAGTPMTSSYALDLIDAA